MDRGSLSHLIGHIYLAGSFVLVGLDGKTAMVVTCLGIWAFAAGTGTFWTIHDKGKNDKAGQSANDTTATSNP